jgi:hypothetical protein
MLKHINYLINVLLYYLSYFLSGDRISQTAFQLYLIRTLV